MVSRTSLHEAEENKHEMMIILAEAEAIAPADRIDPANDDNGLNPDGAVMQDGSTKMRRRKLTEKGLYLKRSTLHSKRRQMNSRLLRQARAIKDLMYRYKNMVTVGKRLHSMITSFHNCCRYIKSTILYWACQIDATMMNCFKKLIKESLHSNTRSIIG